MRPQLLWLAGEEEAVSLSSPEHSLMASFQHAVLKAIELASMSDDSLILNPHLWRPEDRQSWDRAQQPFDSEWAPLKAFLARHPDIGAGDLRLAFHVTRAGRVANLLLQGLPASRSRRTTFFDVRYSTRDCNLSSTAVGSLGTILFVIPKAAWRDGAFQAQQCDALPVATYGVSSFLDLF